MTDERVVELVRQVAGSQKAPPDAMARTLMIVLVSAILSGTVTLIVGFVGAVMFQKWSQADTTTSSAAVMSSRIEVMAADIASMKQQLADQNEGSRQVAVMAATLENVSVQVRALDGKVEGFQSALETRTRDRIYRSEYDEDARRVRLELEQLETEQTAIERRVDRIEQDQGRQP